MSRCRALTLIELLAVIVIAGLIAGVGAVSLGQATASGRDERVALAQARDLVARARLAAQTIGPATLSSVDGALVVLVADGTEVASWTPDGVRCSLESQDGSPLLQVRFGRSGRTDDFAIVLEEPVGVRRLRCSGTTGHCSIAEKEP